ncbi:NYN domain-containing protein [Rhodoferax sp. PAMC 29310]|uniref:NYN domain-containing protein n=1 Tax=Rhodoferax sp. PAMC 29310 TaxID=2822760 RepID=UPI001F0B039B|nr:NYN domain-containing protein [Rhodoferax sp. PAMC 29310]
MNSQPKHQLPSVALYWDFENLHASLSEARLGEGSYGKPDGRFKLQEPVVDVAAVVEFALALGPLAINRAYCNWQFFGRYRDALLQGAVELVQLFPPGAAAKNGADIRLCLDAMQDIERFEHVGSVVIVGGDSDFMPVAQKVKAAGRRLIGIGDRKSTNRHWAKSCDEFIYYDRLVDPMAMPAEPDHSPAALVPRAIRLLARNTGEPWVARAAVWQMVQRMDATLDLQEQGFDSFSDLLTRLNASVEQGAGAWENHLRLRQP